MRKNKTLFAIVCASALFAACSSTDELDPVVQAGQQTEADAVGFDVYTRGSMPSTRAGYVGEIDATAFQVTGFGVYAYVKADDWAGSAELPNFMANQHVNYAGGAWTYSPLKYWPNETNTGTGEGHRVDELGGGKAETTDADYDRVSFFAYAPYVDNASMPYKGSTIPAAAKTDAASSTPSYTGITWLPANDTGGNPTILYRMATDPTNSVDLMYGVAARAYTVNETTGKQGATVDVGKPFLDMTKEVVADKLNYRFKHALTKLAVNVDAYFDEVRNGSTPGINDVDPNTRIVIESIVLKTAKLAVYGELNLNNSSSANTPNWGTVPANAIIKDGGFNSGAGYSLPIANGLKHVTLTADDKYFAQQPLGVTKNRQSLLGYAVDGTTPASLMFVPNTAGDDGMDIVITYKVITRDARLEKGYNVITNAIKQNITSLTFNPGYSTVLNLHLGMTTVKMDAVVSDWDGTDVKEIDLPANVGVASLTATTTINAFGEITPGEITATMVGGGTPPTLGLTDVYFTIDAAGNNILPVTERTTGVYYIPSNYTGAARPIYIWYGGQKYQLANQPVIPNSSDGIEVALEITAGKGSAPDDDKVIATGGTITLTATIDDDVKDFNINDWTLTQKIGSGAETPLSISPTGIGPYVYTVTIPATDAAREFTFKLEHKDGMAISNSVNQIAP